MDPQNSQPVTPPTTPVTPTPLTPLSIPSTPNLPAIPFPEVPKPSSPLTKIAVFLLIISILSLAAYFIGTFVSGKKVISPTPIPTPLSSPSPVTILDPTANWKTYSKDNYQIRYPSDWNISTIAFGFSVGQGGYKINFQTSNPGFGPGMCIFSDSQNFSNPYFDDPIFAASKCPGTFIETKGDQYIFRRKTTQNTSPDGASTGKWSIYVKDNKGNFVTVPPMEYTGPVNYDQTTIELMDQILSTFKFLDKN